MKKIDYIIQIIDELYTRTHIPCIILDEDKQVVYPHIAPIDLLSMLDPHILDIQKPYAINIIIEDECMAYAAFYFPFEGKRYAMLCGCLLNQMSQEHGSLPARWTALAPQEIIYCHIGSEVITSFQSFMKMLYATLHQSMIRDDMLYIQHVSCKVNKKREDDNLTLRRIAQTTPEFYQWEQNFFIVFQEGNLKKMNSLLSQLHLYDIDDVSNQTLEDFKYKYVAFITLLTRTVVRGGASHNTAFALSDRFLGKIKQAQTKEQLSLLFKESIAEFFTLTTSIKNTYSLHISKSIHFIDTHLYDKLSLKDVAIHTELSSSYLSILFKTEMNETITSYIQRKKIEEAQRLLLFTNKSLSEISSLLNFNSQSNFIQIFKKVNHMTPKQYQRAHCKDL